MTKGLDDDLWEQDADKIGKKKTLLGEGKEGAALTLESQPRVGLEPLMERVGLCSP